MKFRRSIVAAAALCLILPAAACSAPAPAPAPQGAETNPPAVSTTAGGPHDSADKPAPPAPKPAPPVEAVAPPASAPPQAPASVPPISLPLTIYYVASGDNGTAGARIGCGDSLVATYTEPVTFTNQLRASMNRLLRDKDQRHGQSGLSNPLFRSQLAFQSGSVVGDTVIVRLSGSLIQGGACDAPRIKAQLEQTAMTAAGAGSATVTVDGKPLDAVLDGKD